MGKANRNRWNKKKDSNEGKATGESSSKKAEAKADRKKVTKVGQTSTEGARACGHYPPVAAEEIKDKEDRSSDMTKEQNSDSEDVSLSEELWKMVKGISESGVISESYQELEAKYARGEISPEEYAARLHAVVADNLESNEYYKSEYPKLCKTVEKIESFKAEKMKLQSLANTLSNLKARATAHETLNDLSEELGGYEETIAHLDDKINKIFGMAQDRLLKAKGIDVATSDYVTLKETSTSPVLTEGIKGQKDGGESTGSTEGSQPAGQSAQSENEEKRSQKDIDVQDIQSNNEMDELIEQFKDCEIRDKNISEASHSSEKDKPKSLKKPKIDRKEFQRGMKTFIQNQKSRLNDQETQNETSTSPILTEEIKGQEDVNESTSSTECIQPAGQSAPDESEDKNEENRSKKDTDDQDIQSKRETEELSPEDCRMQEKNISDASEKDKPKSLKKPKMDLEEFQRGMNNFMADQISSLNKQVAHEDREEVLKAMKKQWDEAAVGFSEEAASDAEEIETHEERRDPEEEMGTVTTSEEVSKIVEVEDEQKEKVIQMEKGDYIHFEYDNDRDRHIFTRENYYFNRLQENQRILFCFNNGTIRVLYTIDRVFVSTPNSEFSFIFRGYRPVDSTAKATQTGIVQ